MTISDQQKSVLSKGLNFAPTPNRIPVARIIANVETALKFSKASSTSVSNARSRIVGILNREPHLTPNLSPSERLALKQLKTNEDIIILLADKGRATVVLDRKDYDGKLLTMLSDTTVYKRLKRDSTSSLERRMNATLLELRRKDQLPERLYHRLHSSCGQTPRIYGLPKIHKPDIPLRPIVSFVTSPTYQLSRHLSFILSPLVGKTSSAVRNSKDFADFISTQQLEEEVLVSFDVVSLFTNVPTDLAIKVARKYLEEDETLEERTLLTVDNIILLLDMCLSATYLQFQQECYQQTQGTAMGSPVSVTVANLVMEDVEQRALSTFRGRCPLFWKRYVDDTCTAIHPEEIEEFHSHLNSIEPSIQFTKEIQQDNKLPFLDINLMKEDDGTISTSVYRKKTHTDQYLQFSSHHPIAHKQAVIRTLFTRASRLSSSLIHRASEERHVVAALQGNGYPSRLILKHRTQGRLRQDNSDKPSARVTLP